MKWVEGITEPEVWTSKGPLGVNKIVEIPDQEADFLIERGQVAATVEPSQDAPKKPRGRPKGSKNKPKAEGDDVEAEEEGDGE